jgi:hypothetical protein
MEDRPGYLAVLKRRLTDEEIAEAERRAEIWRREHRWTRGTRRCQPRN